MLNVFITSNQIPLHVHAVFSHNILFYMYIHCMHLARGMMRMRTPSNYYYTRDEYASLA